MMKVGIVLDDKDFANALARGLAGEGRRLHFSLPEDGWEETAYDLILTDRAQTDRRYVRLTSSCDDQRVFEGPPYSIFRYENAERFVHNLLFIYYLETGRNLEFTGDTRCKTLVFASVSGGLTSTALALATGEILDKHFGCRCLYLNLCPVDGSKRFLPSGRGKGLLTLLYYLDQEKDFPLESFISRNLHVDHIDTSIANPYFDELGPLQMHRLLQKIDGMGKYSYLILDVGNHLSRGNQELIGRAEEVILVTGSSDRLPEPFFEGILQLLQGISGGKIRQIDMEMQKQEKPAALTENGLLDLTSLQGIRWEAGRLVKDLMERNDD